MIYLIIKVLLSYCFIGFVSSSLHSLLPTSLWAVIVFMDLLNFVYVIQNL